MNQDRQSKRVSLELQGNYRVWESDFPFAVITVVNISHTGICFKTDHEVTVGNSVELKLKIPSGESLALLARVIWSNPVYGTHDFNTGVEVMNVNSKDAKKFSQFYSEHLLYPPK